MASPRTAVVCASVPKSIRSSARIDSMSLTSSRPRERVTSPRLVSGHERRERACGRLSRVLQPGLRAGPGRAGDPARPWRRVRRRRVPEDPAQPGRPRADGGADPRSARRAGPQGQAIRRPRALRGRLHRQGVGGRAAARAPGAHAAPRRVPRRAGADLPALGEGARAPRLIPDGEASTILRVGRAIGERTAGGLTLAEAAALDPEAVLERVGSRPEGLTGAEAAARRAAVGPNVISVHRVRAWAVLARQLRSALLALLVVTSAVSFFVGDRTNAAIIAVILAVSVGLGFVNEYRAELAAHRLHTQISHRVVVRRDGVSSSVDVRDLVPGDVVQISLGQVVPADLGITAAEELECDESVLTGESLPAEKEPTAVTTGAELADMSSCAFMGTVVRTGNGQGIVVETGARTEFGRIAAGLGERQETTEFQTGLRHFSVLLVQVAAVVTTSIFVINLVLDRPLLESLLFSIAVAVGITPQLLPAVVRTRLAPGSRRLAARGVLVKRLVCIEDLGDIEVLLTDKTGTLTDGSISFVRAVDPSGVADDGVLRLGLVCNEATIEHGKAVGGNPLDVALWDAAAGTPVAPTGVRTIATIPFDHERRMVSALIDHPTMGRTLVTKGAPESVLGVTTDVPAAAHGTLDAEFAAGSRVVAVATRPMPGATALARADEHDLTLAGFLVFLDRPKLDAADSLRRLATLGITVKVVTGGNAIVAAEVCRDLGLDVRGTMTGTEVSALDDDALRSRVIETTIFARVGPEQKARLIRAHRAPDRDVAFLGDGVNDAVALHAADVGISVESATDVAKDAADIVLLEKSLGVLADGVSEGR